MYKKRVKMDARGWEEGRSPQTPAFQTTFQALQARLLPYLTIARPNYWLRNLFVLPGALIAAAYTQAPAGQFAGPLLLGLIGACLISSANYTINEWLDAEFDRFHPVKQHRPSIAGKVRRRWVYTQYLLLLLAGLGLAALISGPALIALGALAVMGFLYNVRPFRTKERVYLDVLSESINNPIRLLLGWFVVTEQSLPAPTLLLGYWMASAFLMSVKRYAELQFIGDSRQAGLYRRSFQYYTKRSLYASSLFYAICALGLLGIFMAGYHVELVLSLPLWAVLFWWYFRVGMKPDSPAQHPENLFRENYFLAYLILIVIVTRLLSTVQLPWLR